MPDAYGNPGRPSQQVDLGNMPVNAAKKLVAMQNKLSKAKRALEAANKGKGTKQGARLYQDLLVRRRDIFAVSRGALLRTARTVPQNAREWLLTGDLCGHDGLNVCDYVLSFLSQV